MSNGQLSETGHLYRQDIAKVGLVFDPIMLTPNLGRSRTLNYSAFGMDSEFVCKKSVSQAHSLTHFHSERHCKANE